MIKYSTFLVAVVLATTAMAVADETKLDVEPRKNLDRKGFFVLPQSRVGELKVKSVTTTDWLYLEDGKLKDRKRGVRAEYDVFGRLIGFAGHVDQKGYMEVENQYDDEGRLLEERVFSKEGDVRTLAVKSIYDYSEPKVKDRTVFDGDGAILSRARLLLDDEGRVLRLVKLDTSGEHVVAEAKRKYDKKGDFVEEYGDAGRKVHSLKDNVLSVSVYQGPRLSPLFSFGLGKLHSVERYTFDDGGNLLSFFRESGDGSYWDRFTYELDERGLPVEKIWSRLEIVQQDPYELTKYSYGYHE